MKQHWPVSKMGILCNSPIGIVQIEFWTCQNKYLVPPPPGDTENVWNVPLVVVAVKESPK